MLVTFRRRQGPGDDFSTLGMQAEKASPEGQSITTTARIVPKAINNVVVQTKTHRATIGYIRHSPGWLTHRLVSAACCHDQLSHTPAGLS